MPFLKRRNLGLDHRAKVQTLKNDHRLLEGGSRGTSQGGDGFSECNPKKLT
jgi:hypothetical protein